MAVFEIHQTALRNASSSAGQGLERLVVGVRLGCDFDCDRARTLGKQVTSSLDEDGDTVTNSPALNSSFDPFRHRPYERFEAKGLDQNANRPTCRRWWISVSVQRTALLYRTKS